MTFRNYIEQNYNKSKDIIKRNCWKRGIKFDEDIFEDTLIKCLETLIIEQDDYQGYLINSYNNNALRETQYAYNKYKDDVPIPDKPFSNNDIDIEQLYDLLENKFDKDIIIYFKEWVDGDSIRVIEENHKVSGLTYKFKKIREYIKKVW